MKQVLQNLSNGQTEVADVPCPALGPHDVLIETSASLVSAGTERMLVRFGKSNWVAKARQQPDKVRQVIEKMKVDGVAATFEAVQSKLDFPLALGYCNVGVIVAVGQRVSSFQIGDRVVSNGCHAEIVCVPEKLVARVPDCVDDKTASYTVLGAIALQGVRLVEPTIGETVVVIGLGLIGLLAVQILKANGCRVIGVDLNSHRLALAEQMGAEPINPAVQDVVAIADKLTGGTGADAVIIAASTDSNEPIRQAAQMCRKRGRVVLVGVTGLNLSRADFYEKEIKFQVSCSYGPGRYDPNYERRGHDYPVGFVRWTAQRNFETVLQLMEERKIAVDALTTHQFGLADAQVGYDALYNDNNALGILLNYVERDGGPHSLAKQVNKIDRDISIAESGSVSVNVGMVGAGNYGARVLLPALKKSGSVFNTLVTNSGASSYHFGRKFSFKSISTNTDDVFTSGAINTVVIATRHDSHAKLVVKALLSHKHVFVEKPLAILPTELDEIRDAYQRANASGGTRVQLMVGYNRRFSPLIQSIRPAVVANSMPKSIVMTVNAGFIPSNHWVHDVRIGGGRIVGEACHFIDLARYLVGHPIEKYKIAYLGSGPSNRIDDVATLQLEFVDGSMATIHYFANGHKSFPKERIEIFCGGGVIQVDNFRKLKVYGWKGLKSLSLWRQDKGNQQCMQAFVDAVSQGAEAPIPFDEVFEVAKVSIDLANSMIS